VELQAKQQAVDLPVKVLTDNSRKV